MARFNYNDKVFVGVENYHDGDMTGETRFHYFQRGDAVWGIFDGGNVAKGTLVARVLEDDRLAMIWQYLNNDGQFFSGSCTSVPELLDDGRYRLHESWQVTGRDGQTSNSVIEEVRG